MSLAAPSKASGGLVQAGNAANGRADTILATAARNFVSDAVGVISRTTWQVSTSCETESHLDERMKGGKGNSDYNMKPQSTKTASEFTAAVTATNCNSKRVNGEEIAARDPYLACLWAFGLMQRM